MKAIRSKNKVTANGEVLPPAKDKKELSAMAKKLDSEIRHECSLVQQSLTKLAEHLSKMRELQLWKFLSDKNHQTGFRHFEEYANSALGSTLGRTTLYDLLAIHELTRGSNPIAPHAIDKLGRGKAVQLVRLPPEDRKDMLKYCLGHSVPAVRGAVQARLNLSLPKDEQKEPTLLFSIHLPESTYRELEQFFEIGVWMEGIRDGDRTQSLRQKLFFAMIRASREYYHAELAEAFKYKEARNRVEAAGSIEENEYVPEPEEVGGSF